MSQRLVDFCSYLQDVNHFNKQDYGFLHDELAAFVTSLKEVKKILGILKTEEKNQKWEI